MRIGHHLLEKIARRMLKINSSYSQEGEDLILGRALEERRSGFFVDVGAHHPMRFSNTFLFYRRGWSGINIDPLIGESGEFKTHRNRDINIPFGVSGKPGELEYFHFNEPALNTFSPEKRDSVLSLNRPYRLIGSRKIRTMPLREILEKYLPVEQRIDFLSVDVEGLDLEVLESNDWAKFRPEFVIYEDHLAKVKPAGHGDKIFSLEIESPAGSFLRQQGYIFFAKTVSSWIFRDGRSQGHPV
jgi:FkbM family methyltransferase